MLTSPRLAVEAQRAGSRGPGVAVGLQLLTRPPLAASRLFMYFARFNRLASVWTYDHLQNVFPLALWDRRFTWAASQTLSPHELFDPFVLLGALAASAGHLRLGVGVTDVTRHHPVLLAQSMLTLAHLTRTPPILGLGAGERMNLEPYGFDTSARFGRLEEALPILRQCFAHDGALSFQGHFFQLDRARLDLRAPPGRTPEIWLGGQGPRMLRLTGQYGDGWFPDFVASPEAYAAKLDIIRSAACEAGRNPEAITPGLCQFVVLAPSEQRARAMLETPLARLTALAAPAEAWRAVGASHPFGEHFRGPDDWLPERFTRAELDAALAAVPGELLGYGMLWGTPPQVASKLHAFGRAGLRHVLLIPASALVSRGAALYSLLGIRSIGHLLRADNGAERAAPAVLTRRIRP
jgi:phthiodiolone/phenolphthiodiolone dimycocerosates ketoreductase